MLIRYIVFHLVDSAIQILNNRGQIMVKEVKERKMIITVDIKFSD